MIVIYSNYPLMGQILKEIVNSVSPEQKVALKNPVVDLELVDLSLDENSAVKGIILCCTGESEKLERIPEKIKARFPQVPWMAITMEASRALISQIKNNEGLICDSSEGFSEVHEIVQGMLNKEFSENKRNGFSSEIQISGRKPLTHKQVQVMQYIAEGLTAKMMAREMGMSPETVRAHIKEAYLRLDARSRGEAVAKFIQLKNFATKMNGLEV